ncbi:MULTISPECIES: DUF1972 domain-containing protein [Methanobacterium]|uniref:DUF1972 domain-containing protein n=1 Tax=Methanobacterium veterum TaxID=408577 RepID=A0A9E5A1S1_9EURY|nr:MULTISPECIES: DUF1972 domain-containing protein [Methanobacterium]MCZ3367523.1 DUF1972 domain-containing protein [Methanobacterium veterum]MCZ3373329.1 DUF1972 domain-containing protein [Methanobacterium veterum]
MNDTEKPSIAIIGSRGIPNRYGGFEKFAEIISTELVKKGNNVYVSCEYAPDPKNSEYNGVHLFYFPIKPPKINLFRIIYEFLYDGYSLLWASKNADYVYMLGYSAAIFFFIPKLFGKSLWVNPDGIEWRRNKFNSLVKFLLKLSEKIAVFWADELIADSKEIKKYLDNRYNTNSIYISYGASEIQNVKWDSEKLSDCLKGVKINPSYYLVVARLEPENNIDIIVEGYLKSKTEKPLIVVGNFADLRYEHEINEILNSAPEDKKIIFTGGIYDMELLNMLRQNCSAYIHGHSVGGTNPSLLEAMVSKNLIIAHDNVFNREVCDKYSVYFNNSNELKASFDLVESQEFNNLECREGVFDRVKKVYSWDKIVDQYNALITSVTTGNEVNSEMILSKNSK